MPNSSDEFSRSELSHHQTSGRVTIDITGMSAFCYQDSNGALKTCDILLNLIWDHERGIPANPTLNLSLTPAPEENLEWQAMLPDQMEANGLMSVLRRLSIGAFADAVTDGTSNKWELADPVVKVVATDHRAVPPSDAGGYAPIILKFDWHCRSEKMANLKFTHEGRGMRWIHEGDTAHPEETLCQPSLDGLEQIMRNFGLPAIPFPKLARSAYTPPAPISITLAIPAKVADRDIPPVSLNMLWDPNTKSILTLPKKLKLERPTDNGDGELCLNLEGLTEFLKATGGDSFTQEFEIEVI